MACIDNIKEDDEVPELSGNALAALQEFYNDRDAQQNRFQELKLATESKSQQKLSMDMFTEDWNASQFWYNDETALILAKEILDDATAKTCIAVVSAPSAFIQIKNLLASAVGTDRMQSPELCLLEFDNRFALLKEFVRYDFHAPLKLPPAITVRWLSKPSGTGGIMKPCPRIIVCTGERMESLVHKVYPGTHTTTFEPQHTQGRLSNEFRCYANYECDSWSWR
ncbi:hypothetical protein MMC32_007937 [Xylographa parallela]|nr:hypothetical protein [Xylographa parallela]